jgi:hypothetical protein
MTIMVRPVNARASRNAPELASVQAGQLAEQLGGLPGLLPPRSEPHAVGQVGVDRVGQESRLVPEHQRAEAHGDVDVGVAVHVRKVSATGLTGRDRVQQLLGGTAETRDGPRVGERPPIPLGEPFRARRPAGVPVGQVGEVGPLPLIHP